MSWMWRLVFAHAHTRTHAHAYTHPSPWHRSPPTHSPCHAMRSVCVRASLKEREEVPRNITAWPATPSSNAKAAGWPFVMYINLCRPFTWQAIVPHDPTASSLPLSLLHFEQVGRIVCREARTAVPLSVVMCVCVGGGDEGWDADPSEWGWPKQMAGQAVHSARINNVCHVTLSEKTFPL